jgi:hypothetical protein
MSTDAVTFDQDQIDFERKAFELADLEQQLVAALEPEGKITQKKQGELQAQIDQLKADLSV